MSKHPTSPRSASMLMLALALLGLWQGCNHVDTAERRIVMIFVDISLSSLPDRENYKSYIEKVISKLQPGDVVAGGKIIDLTIADFTPIFYVELPPFDFWNDNRTLHKKMVERLTGRMFASIDSVLRSRGKVEKSEIINSFLVCEQFMRNKTGKKSMVILSDMLECSSEFNFERDELNADYVDQAIQSLKAKGRIPNLQNVEVWIAGAHATTSEKYFTVQSFWNRFLKETGANCRAYSHTLLDFE
ncbi:MAG: hypothetical protein ONB44_18990 [candidate division KSB1 bacterium]|nr:hypothetical protein [candidate division KSB1 bacterium]MDZ7304218.1 hypothetical protein [candidate division KSB1 bacterium]MDZ7311693.1 hypothetical protein [candidate division KSB1 bacterium]